MNKPSNIPWQSYGIIILCSLIAALFLGLTVMLFNESFLFNTLTEKLTTSGSSWVLFGNLGMFLIDPSVRFFFAFLCLIFIGTAIWIAKGIFQGKKWALWAFLGLFFMTYIFSSVLFAGVSKNSLPIFLVLIVLYSNIFKHPYYNQIKHP